MQQAPRSPEDESNDASLTALSTLSLLDLRLSRLEHLLTGASSTSTFTFTPTPATPLDRTFFKDSSNVVAQLRTLESRLTNLKRLDGLPGSIVRMVDSLRREYPDIFTSPRRSSDVVVETHTAVPTHELSQRAHQVLANSTLFTTTSAHLQTLQTLKIPQAEHSARLIDATPRLRELQRRQESLSVEIEELRNRSAGVLEWWMKNGVVGMGELWEDWEHRVRDCEKTARREERRVAEERGEIG